MPDFCSQGRARLQELLDDGPDAPDVAALRAHLPSCPDCAHDLAMLRHARTELQALPSVAAPPDLRARVRAQIEDEARQRRLPSARLSWLRRPMALAWSGGLTLAAICLLWLAQPRQFSTPDSATENAAPSIEAPATGNRLETGDAPKQAAKPRRQQAPRTAPTPAPRTPSATVARPRIQSSAPPRAVIPPQDGTPPQIAAAPRFQALPRQRASVPKARVEPEVPALTAPRVSSGAPKLAPPVATKPRLEANTSHPLTARLVPLPDAEMRRATGAASKGHEQAFVPPTVQNAPAVNPAQPDADASSKAADSGGARDGMSQSRRSSARGGAAADEGPPQLPSVAAPAPSNDAPAGDADSNPASSAVAPSQEAPPAMSAAPAPVAPRTAPDGMLQRRRAEIPRARATIPSENMVRTRLEVVPASDIARAALRLDFPTGVRSTTSASARVVVWRGRARKGQKIVVPLSLRLQKTASAAFHLSLIDEAGKVGAQSRRIAVGTK